MYRVVDSSIDEAKSMLLSWCELDIAIRASTSSILIGAIDENVVREWWRTASLQVDVGTRFDGSSSLVVPVADCVCAEIEIIIGCCRAIDVDCADDTVAILGRKMRMVPRCQMC